MAALWIRYDLRAIIATGAVLTGLWIAAIGVAGATPAAAADGADAFIQAMGYRALQILASGAETDNERRLVAAIKDMVLEDIDLAAIGRFVLGSHMRQMTPAQMSRYEKLFRDYVLISTALRLSTYRAAHAHFRITTRRQTADGDIMIETIVERPGKPDTHVGWRVRRERGGFKIVDVVIEGVSMALTQRQEFASVIAAHGLDGLMNLMQKKVAELQPPRVKD